MKRYGMVIDLDRCNGCGACMVACAVENNVPPPLPRENARTSITPMRVYRMTSGTQTAFIPVMCQQCGDHPPCATVCPQQAVEIDTNTGIVSQMPQRCLGCRYCMTACPYHARYFNWSDPEWPAGMEKTLNPDVAPRMRGVVEKCNFCHGRYQAARSQAAASGSKDVEYTPACAEACPSQAIHFVDLKTTKPEGIRMLERIGTEPKIYYKSQRQWVQAKLGTEVKHG